MLWPKKGMKGCKYHREGINKGENNGNYKHGRYSKYLPKDIGKLIDELKESRREGEMLSLADQIDLAEARIVQLVKQLDTSASEQTWRDIGSARTAIMAGIKSGDANQINAALNTLQEISQKGTKEYRAWDELFRAQRHYNTLITSERKKMIEDKFMVAVDEIGLIFEMVGQAIFNRIQDAKLRAELGSDIRFIAAKAGFDLH